MVYYNTQERDRVLDHLRRDTERLQTRAGMKRFHSASSLETPHDKHVSKTQNQEARIESFRKVIRYCESTARCRHQIIKELSDDLELESKASSAAAAATAATATTKTTTRTTRTHSACSQLQLPALNIKKEQPMLKKEDDENLQPASIPDPHPSSPCNYACDFCKEGEPAVALRKARMVPPSPPGDMVDMTIAPYMHMLFPELFRGSRAAFEGFRASP